MELASRDLEAYRDAVAAGNFMAMRRAAYAPGSPVGSAKLGRLVEIVEEASANGRKVVVFSYFRDVLDTVALRPRRRGARPANRKHPAGPTGRPWSTSSAPAAAPRSW